MADDDDSRTEEPTDKKKEQFHSQGQIAYSREIGATLAFVSIMTVLFWYSTELYDDLQRAFANIFGSLGPWSGGVVPTRTVLFPVLLPILGIMGLILLVAFVAPLIGHWFQKGMDPKYEAAMPSFEKLNPIEGAKRIVSMQTFQKMFQNILRTIGLLAIFYVTVSPHTERIIHAARMPMEAGTAVFFTIFSSLLKNCILFLVILACVDYYFKWREIHKKMMMTRQEIKDEMKDAEGNPEVKNKIKAIQRERAKRKANKEVPKATVVIANPTHFAIAIKYKAGETPVPYVVSKGSDYLALKIREIAKDNRVPVVENPPLARALYRDVKEGKEIPSKYFKPVAKIIAAILRLEQERKAQQAAQLQVPMYSQMK